MAIGDQSSSGLATEYIKCAATKTLNVLNRFLAPVSWSISRGPRATRTIQWSTTGGDTRVAAGASTVTALQQDEPDAGGQTQQAHDPQPLLPPPSVRTIAPITPTPAYAAQERRLALKRENLNLHRHSAYHERVEKLAFRMHGLLSVEECQRLITVADEEGYAKLSPFREVRGWHSDALAEQLWHALESHMPSDIWGCSVIGISDRFFMYKDSPGYECNEYYDELYERSHDKAVSYVSVWIDLNEAFEGGRLTFMKRVRPSTLDVVVEPRTGSATVLQHNILYQKISTLTTGVRYTLRTDVMCASPQQRPRATSSYR